MFVFPNAYEVSNDTHKYLTFGSHISSFTSMINLMFLCLAVVFGFTNAYEVLSDIYKCFTMACLVSFFSDPLSLN